MKVEILLCQDINEKCSGSTCFDATPEVAREIKNEKEIKGVIIIDDVPTKFYFSSMGMDGNIFTNDNNLRLLIKKLIPLYVFRSIYK